MWSEPKILTCMDATNILLPSFRLGQPSYIKLLILYDIMICLHDFDFNLLCLCSITIHDDIQLISKENILRCIFLKQSYVLHRSSKLCILSYIMFSIKISIIGRRFEIKIEFIIKTFNLCLEMQHLIITVRHL
jgi:hypothetical protein